MDTPNLDHLVRIAAHGSGCPSAHGHERCHCSVNGAKRELAELSALKQRVEDLEACLRATRYGKLRYLATFQWAIGDCSTLLADDGTGLPILTEEAREALRGAR